VKESELDNSEGLWQGIKLHHLIRASLRAVPTWEKHKTESHLHRRIIKPRAGYYGTGSELDLPFDDLDLSLSLARCFGDEKEGVAFLGLITTQQRYLSADSVAELRKRIGSMKLPQLPQSSNPALDQALRSIHFQWKGVLEAR
jgi:hypothetical protein